MSALSLGTAQFGLPYGVANQRGQISLDDARAILRCAESAGIDTLDTAIAYGDSEDRLGEIGVASWQVISKLPGIPEDCTDVATWVSHAVEAATIDKKCKALAAYEDEMRHAPHPRSEEVVRALARFRGTQVGVAYAEGFILVRGLNV